MNYVIQQHRHHCDINLTGQFGFSDHQRFRQILDALNDKTITSLTLNFHEVPGIDSAALGMLLLLRDKSSERGVKLTLVQPQGQVKKIFAVSRFEQMFLILD